MNLLQGIIILFGLMGIWATVVSDELTDEYRLKISLSIVAFMLVVWLLG